jgi:hypothetical protein
MEFELELVRKVEETIEGLRKRDPRRHKRVVKCLAMLAQDPTYPGLSSHPYTSVRGALGETIWESYVENNSPSAWRVWWHYGSDHRVIVVVDLGPHP